MRVLSKYTIKYFFGLNVVLCCFLLTACPTPPEFSDTPRIAFEAVRTFTDTLQIPDGPKIGQQIISLSLYFEDGNGDLGLQSDADLPIYDPYIIPRNSNNQPIYLGDSDTLPPFNRDDYYVVSDPEDENGEFVGQVLVLPGDTLYVQFNPRSQNIFIEFYYKPTNNAEFVQYNFDGQFNGRYPLLNTESYDRPLNGSLNYEMKSSSFSSIFRLQPIKLEVYIVDRKNNKSNTIVTDPFTLSF